MKTSSKDKKTITILIGILVIAILGAVYYYVIYPKSETKSQAIQVVEMLKSETSELQNQLTILSEEKGEEATDSELRKKLPANRELNQLLRTLNEVEKNSGATIQSISFNTYDTSVTEANILLPEPETTESEETADNNAGEENNEPVTPLDIASLPPQLKFISLSAEINVKDISIVVNLLEEIEKVERVVRIDSVSFNQNNEQQEIAVTIQLTTFYSEDGAN
jgi:type IV pilus assembly protein PilO